MARICQPTFTEEEYAVIKAALRHYREYCEGGNREDLSIVNRLLKRMNRKKGQDAGQ